MIVGSIGTAFFQNGASPVNQDTDLEFRSDLNFFFDREESFFWLLLWNEAITVLNDQPSSVPVPFAQNFQRAPECIPLRGSRGGRVHLDARHHIAVSMLAQLAHALAQLAGESQRGLATLPIWRGQAEVRVLPNVLHGAGDGGDGIEIPVRGE